jgi:hypothetical protein
MSGLIRVTCNVWLVFGYCCKKRGFLAFLCWRMFCIAKDKKEIG